MSAVVFLSSLLSLAGFAQAPTHLTAQQAVKFLKDNPKAIVLDVRTPAEFETGHLVNAVNLDYKSPDFAQQVAKLDPSKTYLVHCAVGGRSTQTLPVLEKLGFRHVQHLDGGIQAWQGAGFPVTKN